jgi:hypothetical protein
MTSNITMHALLLVCAEKDIGFLFTHCKLTFDVPMALLTSSGFSIVSDHTCKYSFDIFHTTTVTARNKSFRSNKQNRPDKPHHVI